MIDHFKFAVLQQTEASAHVILEQAADGPVRAFTASLRGPHCQFARTLPAEFSFSPIAMQPEAHFAQVIDPCYWTPDLPFLYDLQFKVQLTDGQEIEQTTKVGLTRWESHGQNLRLETRRVVLRGAGATSPNSETIRAAREAQTALLISEIDPTVCETADELGVALCLDLRGTSDADLSVLANIQGSPSLLLAIVSPQQVVEQKVLAQLPSHCLIAQHLSTSAPIEEFLDSKPFLAFDLKPGERPSAWVPKATRPVIAIRRGEDYTDLAEARAACDRLQAELAPEFDFAGYFVTP